MLGIDLRVVVAEITSFFLVALSDDRPLKLVRGFGAPAVAAMDPLRTKPSFDVVVRLTSPRVLLLRANPVAATTGDMPILLLTLDKSGV